MLDDVAITADADWFWPLVVAIAGIAALVGLAAWLLALLDVPMWVWYLAGGGIVVALVVTAVATDFRRLRRKHEREWGIQF